MSKPTDTNQASEDELDTVLKQHREWMRGIRTDRLIGTSHAETKAAIQSIIRTEKLKLLAEVRERVVGEDDEQSLRELSRDIAYEVATVLFEINTTRNVLKREQRESLEKMEAEL